MEKSTIPLHECLHGMVYELVSRDGDTRPGVWCNGAFIVVDKNDPTKLALVKHRSESGSYVPVAPLFRLDPLTDLHPYHAWCERCGRDLESQRVGNNLRFTHLDSAHHEVASTCSPKPHAAVNEELLAVLLDLTRP